MSRTHLMIDIETLSTKPNAVILSVGGLWFDPHAGYGPSKMAEGFGATVPVIVPNDCEVAFHLFLNPVPQQNEGRHVDAETAMWWMQQSDDARFSMVDRYLNHSYSTIEDSKKVINNAIAKAGHIWANGPEFDCVILADFMKEYKWPFWKHKCVRTVKDLFVDKKDRDSFKYGVAHDAISDCYTQANMVCHAYGKVWSKS